MGGLGESRPLDPAPTGTPARCAALSPSWTAFGSMAMLRMMSAPQDRALNIWALCLSGVPPPSRTLTSQPSFFAACSAPVAGDTQPLRMLRQVMTPTFSFLGAVTEVVGPWYFVGDSVVAARRRSS